MAELGLFLFSYFRGPQKLSAKSKKAQILNSWLLSMAKKLGIEPGFDGKSVMYLMESIAACCYIVDPYVLFLIL